MAKNKNNIKDTLKDIGQALKKDAKQTKEDVKDVMPHAKGSHEKK